MITDKGIAYFLNRLISNQTNVINGVVLGTGLKIPSGRDTRLTNPTLIKTCTPRIDLKNRRLILSVRLTAKELEGITEIGATSNGELLTHDLVTGPIDPVVNDINLEYIIELENAYIQEVWKKHEQLYEIRQPDFVKGVTEESTNSGYKRVNNTEEVSTGTYYYDESKEMLYIRTIDDKSPSSKEIKVITK